MATMAQRRDLSKMIPIQVEHKGARVDLDLPVELVDAMVDFHSNRDSGKIEVHYSQGGVAKIFANVSRTYK